MATVDEATALLEEGKNVGTKSVETCLQIDAMCCSTYIYGHGCVSWVLSAVIS